MGCRMSDQKKVSAYLLTPATGVPISMPNQKNRTVPDCAPSKICDLALVSIYLDNASRREHIHHTVVVCANTGIAKSQFLSCCDAIRRNIIKFSFRGSGVGRPTERKMLMRRNVVWRSRKPSLISRALPQNGTHACHIYSIPLQNFFIGDPETVSKTQNLIETWDRAGLDSCKDGMADYATRVLNCKRKMAAHSFDL